MQLSTVLILIFFSLSPITTAYTEKAGILAARSELGERYADAQPGGSSEIGPRGRRVGDATYAVPVNAQGDRRQALGVKAPTEATRKKSNPDGKADAPKKSETVHQMPESNKKFNHYQW